VVGREELLRAGQVVPAHAGLLVEHRGQEVAGVHDLRLAVDHAAALLVDDHPHRAAEQGDGDHQHDPCPLADGHRARQPGKSAR
jgi:hypothetical protein